MFERTIIIDVDLTEHGWELVARFGPEDLICAFTDVSDADLADIIGGPMAAQVAQALIAERDHECTT